MVESLKDHLKRIQVHGTGIFTLGKLVLWMLCAKNLENRRSQCGTKTATSSPTLLRKNWDSWNMDHPTKSLSPNTQYVLSIDLRPGKLTWQWKNNHLKVHLIFRMVIFQPAMLHVSFQGGYIYHKHVAGVLRIHTYYPLKLNPPKNSCNAESKNIGLVNTCRIR